MVEFGDNLSPGSMEAMQKVMRRLNEEKSTQESNAAWLDFISDALELVENEEGHTQ